MNINRSKSEAFSYEVTNLTPDAKAKMGGCEMGEAQKNTLRPSIER